MLVEGCGSSSAAGLVEGWRAMTVAWVQRGCTHLDGDLFAVDVFDDLIPHP